MPTSPTEMRAWWRARPTATQDVISAAAACVLGLLVLFLEPQNVLLGVLRAPDALAVALVAGMTLPLAFRRRAPVWCLVVPAASALLGLERGYAVFLTAFVVLFGVASAARCTDRRTSVRLGAVSGMLVTSVTATDVIDGPTTTSIVGGIIFGVGPAVVGDAFRMQKELTAAVRAHALRLEELRDAELHGARTRGRIEMARDVHDIVGHHLSAISLQAAAGQAALGSGGDPGAAFRGIRAEATKALNETRTMHAALRHDEPDLRPSPRMADIATLAEELRAAGRDVRVDISGAVRDLPAGLETNAHRILEEALMHLSDDAVAHVDIEYRESHLGLRVRADGGAEPQDRLAGIRERVGLLGGELLAGPTSRGDWRLVVRLPLEP